jgi:hypothetical protein
VAKSRGRVIDDVVIEVILHILDSWKGKLTWDALILEIKANIATTYTRQALSNHERISSAFVLRKLSLAKEQGRTSSGDSRLDSMMETVSALKAENIRLHAECERYRAQFIRWVYNSQRKNLTFEQLDAPMPPVHRGRSSE